MGFGMYNNHLTLSMPSINIICLENSIDPDQLASQKPADLGLRCFQLCLKIHTSVWNPESHLDEILGRSVVDKNFQHGKG